MWPLPSKNCRNKSTYCNVQLTVTNFKLILSARIVNFNLSDSYSIRIKKKNMKNANSNNFMTAKLFSSSAII
jgi:hypothetical protein